MSAPMNLTAESIWDDDSIDTLARFLFRTAYFRNDVEGFLSDDAQGMYRINASQWHFQARNVLSMILPKLAATSAEIALIEAVDRVERAWDAAPLDGSAGNVGYGFDAARQRLTALAEEIRDA